MRHRRHALKISQITLARKLGISRRHLIRVENGERPASDEMAKKISRALEIPVRQLFSTFALDKRLAVLASPADDAREERDDNGRWILEMSLSDKSMVRLEIPSGAEHERVIGKFSEPIKAGKDRNPFLHIDTAQYLVFVNLDHVEVATLSQEFVDVSDDSVEAGDHSDSLTPELETMFKPRFHELPEVDGWAVMSSGYEETPLMLVNADSSVALAPMDAARARDAFLRCSATWTAGGKITLTNGKEMSSYLVDATMLLFVPLNSRFVPANIG
nr:helix-turn-helix transcriptional regulator [Caballeronia arationis]